MTALSHRCRPTEPSRLEHRCVIKEFVTEGCNCKESIDTIKEDDRMGWRSPFTHTSYPRIRSAHGSAVSHTCIYDAASIVSVPCLYEYNRPSPEVVTCDRTPQWRGAQRAELVAECAGPAARNGRESCADQTHDDRPRREAFGFASVAVWVHTKLARHLPSREVLDRRNKYILYC